MTSRKDDHLEAIRSVHGELLGLLEGMDYCLDWKSDPSAWSARQVVYHLLDSPPGGTYRVLSGILSGELKEFDIVADLDNLTPERLGYDAEQIREGRQRVLSCYGKKHFARAVEEDFDDKSAVLHLKPGGVDEVRTVPGTAGPGFQVALARSPGTNTGPARCAGTLASPWPGRRSASSGTENKGDGSRTQQDPLIRRRSA